MNHSFLGTTIFNVLLLHARFSGTHRRIMAVWLCLFLMPEHAKLWGADTAFQQKKDLLLAYVADHYRPPAMNIGDPEKYYFPHIIARIARYGTADASANAQLEALRGRDPFHFGFTGLARLLCGYPQTAALQHSRPEYLKAIFNRQDSYNAFTGEGTENHISMSRTNGYLFACLGVADGLPTAHGRLAEMEHWIRHAAKRLQRYGGGEWNSGTYEVFNLMGWLNLYDFAPSADIRKAAKAVLDHYALEMALHYNRGGVSGGSEMRGSGLGVETATQALNLFWFGEVAELDAWLARAKGNNAAQAVYAAVSTYRPPPKAFQLANCDRTAFDRWWRPSYLYEKKRFVRLSLYRTPSFTLGSSACAYGGFTGATAQIIPWKLVLRPGAPTAAPPEIGGNGTFFPQRRLKGRDPFTQVVQHRNVLIQLTRRPPQARQIFDTARAIARRWDAAWRTDFVRRFPTDTFRTAVVSFDTVVNWQNQSCLLLPAGLTIDWHHGVGWGDWGGVFVQIRTLSGRSPEAVPQGAFHIWRDEAPVGQLCGFLLVVFERREFDDFAHFQREMNTRTSLRINNHTLRYRSYQGQRIRAAYGDRGTCIEAISDWGYGPTTPQVLTTSPPLRMPRFPRGTGWGRVARLRVF
jgi:hypothetical protein